MSLIADLLSPDAVAALNAIVDPVDPTKPKPRRCKRCGNLKATIYRGGAIFCDPCASRLDKRSREFRRLAMSSSVTTLRTGAATWI